MTERKLTASIDNEVVGTLRENQNLWAFEYAASWLENPARFALSPHLPLSTGVQLDGATTRPTQWYFDNLLPEESVRELMARDAGLPDISDAFALLEHYGGESAGSVTLRSPGEVPEEGSLKPLKEAELAGRIQKLPTVPLSHDAPKKMSLAGAQHKLPVVLRDGKLFEPGGAQASTHILKPNHPKVAEYPHTVANEWFVMRLAARVRLDVPEVERRYLPAPVYLIKRFDREETDGAVSRRHAIDGCQLLNLPPTMKYSGWSIDSLARLGYACRTSASARLRIFRWLVFCVLVGNGDSHLKNLSFLVDEHGILLSPHYDLLSEAVYETTGYSDKGRWPDMTEFTREIGGMQRYADFSYDLLVGTGEQLGMARETAARNIDQLLATVPVQADILLAQVEAENRELITRNPVLNAPLGGEYRLLLAIRHVVIRDMVERISRRA